MTRVGGALGGKNLVIRLEGEFHDEKVRPTSEIDVPIDQRSNRFNASLGLALGWRHELTLVYERSRIDLRDSMLVLEDAPVEDRLNRSEENYVLRIARRLTGKTSLVLEGNFRRWDFDDDDLRRDAREYGAMSGFVFAPRGNLRGQALLGFQRLAAYAAGEADFQGLVGAVDVEMNLGERLRLRALYSRAPEASALGANRFFIENRAGGSAEMFLVRSFSIEPGVMVGRNRYRRPETLEGEAGLPIERRIVDRSRTFSLGLHYYLQPAWSIDLGASYLERISNFQAFDKERLLVNLGISTRF